MNMVMVIVGSCLLIEIQYRVTEQFEDALFRHIFISKHWNLCNYR